MGPMETVNQPNSPEGPRKTVALPLPLPVIRTIAKLGDDINRARRRRRMSQQSLAERVGASLTTIKRMEAGDPRVPLHFLARTMYVFGELDRLNQLLDSGHDEIGLMLIEDQLPKRIRAKRNPGPQAL